MASWGAPVVLDDNTAVLPKDKPEDVNPNLLVTHEMGATIEEVRENDHLAHAKTSAPEIAPHAPPLAPGQNYPQAPVYGGQPPAHGGGYNPEVVDQKAYVPPQPAHSTFSDYRYHIKENVLCTADYPPPAEEHWKLGKVCELMLDRQLRIKLYSGDKVVVKIDQGQVRPCSDEEAKKYKKDHRDEAEFPCWLMVVCCPCLMLAAPFYFFGCCGECTASDAIIDCCDVCEGCCDGIIDCCEGMEECCMECCSCLSCGMC